MVMPIGNEDRPRITAWATFGLIALNLGGFALELAQPPSFAVAYAMTPYEITHDVDIHDPFRHLAEPDDRPNLAEGLIVHQAAGPRPVRLTLISALFLHVDSLHLAGNLLFLFIFGQKVEEALGRARFLIFYLACGLVGGLAQVVATPESLIPTLGASGAIAGVMGASLVRFPRDRIRVLFLNVVVLVPAYAVIGCWIALQVLRSVVATGPEAAALPVAYLAHLAGAATGIGLSLGQVAWGARGGQSEDESELAVGLAEDDAVAMRDPLPERPDLEHQAQRLEGGEPGQAEDQVGLPGVGRDQ